MQLCMVGQLRPEALESNHLYPFMFVIEQVVVDQCALSS